MDDDSYIGFELFSSQPEKRSYDGVPVVATQFKFKIKDPGNARKISYKL